MGACSGVRVGEFSGPRVAGGTGACASEGRHIATASTPNAAVRLANFLDFCVLEAPIRFLAIYRQRHLRQLSLKSGKASTRVCKIKGGSGNPESEMNGKGNAFVAPAIYFAVFAICAGGVRACLTETCHKSRVSPQESRVSPQKIEILTGRASFVQ